MRDCPVPTGDEIEQLIYDIGVPWPLDQILNRRRRPSMDRMFIEEGFFSLRFMDLIQPFIKPWYFGGDHERQVRLAVDLAVDYAENELRAYLGDEAYAQQYALAEEERRQYVGVYFEAPAARLIYSVRLVAQARLRMEVGGPMTVGWYARRSILDALYAVAGVYDAEGEDQRVALWHAYSRWVGMLMCALPIGRVVTAELD